MKHPTSYILITILDHNHCDVYSHLRKTYKANIQKLFDEFVEQYKAVLINDGQDVQYVDENFEFAYKVFVYGTILTI
jgi:UDP-N-acetylmuramate-alanine ligase